MTPTHLLYLHGFRSSPLSTKAGQVAARVERLQASGQTLHWHCPQLPPSPAQAVRELLARLADWPLERSAILGSSLGGFYATVLAERLGCPAVVLNPAVDPARDLARHIGEQRAWHSEERFYFRPEYVDELRALTPGRLTRLERYFAVIAKGDELLDWREMAARYRGAPQRVIDGSDHALSDFPAHIDAVFAFLGLG
ncbi:esterase [Aquabacterium sp. A7-Y]|uniref:YqiA/YcfP family alpha/beta fold hydrolase n=1 Tax=Aquabacterium sp. A7-Y TaxID=1349605 RepID=UPI00223E6B30|nr:YqiA/YcfP family alpha/beta fold hydrolase [Aquabacterium sp. A7-Y]MCW7537448.1 esterase [Aquabacterium sp. A7-Y]